MLEWIINLEFEAWQVFLMYGSGLWLGYMLGKDAIRKHCN